MHPDYDLHLVVRRMSHHAGPSGYDRLADFTAAHIIGPPKSWRFSQRLLLRSLKKAVTGSGSRWYHRDSLYQEIKAAMRWPGRHKKIFHFLYGENSYRYLGLMKHWSDNKIVCTYHTPYAKFKETVTDRKHLQRIDLAIVVSTTQIAFFTELLGPGKVAYVPHGVDTDYYQPPAESRSLSQPLRCLFVGAHLRDFQTLLEAVRILNGWGHPDFFLTVVTHPSFHHLFASLEKVQCLSGIADDRLLSLYRQSDVLLLPLLEATANNTLLEAMACGLPIITTDTSGVRDYVSEQCAFLSPPWDSEALAAAVARLPDNPDRLAKMARAARERAMQFGWPKIADQIIECYHSLW